MICCASPSWVCSRDDDDARWDGGVPVSGRETTGAVHATAVVHHAVRMGGRVVIGPYAVVEDGVDLGDGVVLAAHAVVRSGTVLGAGTSVGEHAVIGGWPQDLKFDPRTPSGVQVGVGVTLREGVTVNRATSEGAFTEIGDGAFLMAGAHVGHDCVLGSNVILANNVMVAGLVRIGDYVFVGGGAAFHQGARVGEGAMVSGLSRMSRDVPPFTMVAERDEVVGLNLVGMRRRGFVRDAVREIKEAYRRVYGGAGSRRARAAEALDARPWLSAEARGFLEFFAEGKRGFVQPRKHGEADAGE